MVPVFRLPPGKYVRYLFHLVGSSVLIPASLCLFLCFFLPLYSSYTSFLPAPEVNSGEKIICVC